MPLILCPNCNTSMQEVRRDEVAIDMCPACRGVWLDRGELEKLLGAVREERAEVQRFTEDRERFYRDPEDYKRSQPKYDDDDRKGYDPRYRKKRGFDLFDIFD
ncbi:MAG: zf-TFIIB domain-containing protein [Hyphomonadaceae bacterium]